MSAPSLHRESTDSLIHSKDDDDEGHELSNKGCCMYRKEMC